MFKQLQLRLGTEFSEKHKKLNKQPNCIFYAEVPDHVAVVVVTDINLILLIFPITEAKAIRKLALYLING